MIKRFTVPLLAAMLLVPLAPGIAAAGGLQWRPCAEIAKDWVPGDTRSECALVEVPVDYANPDGRRIGIAISRIKATGNRRGVVLLNPGGPGQSGMDLPRHLSESKAARLGVHHDLIGFAPRGVDYSSDLACTMDTTEPPESLPEKEKARFKSERDARSNQACVAADPELVRNVTTANIARDMDRIRLALGEQKIGYYGVSWGTALGAEYRTLFDGNVDKMLLDSVMLPSLSLTTMDDDELTASENMFHQFASWIARYDSVYHFGDLEPIVAQALIALRDRVGGGVNDLLAGPMHAWPDAAKQLAAIRDGAAATPKPGSTSAKRFGWDANPNGFNHFQQTTLLCNESTSTRDFETVWNHRQELKKKLPVAGGYGTWDGICAGWPIPAQPWQFTPGKSPLQLVGHTYEPVTPIGWALAMQQQIGGALLTVRDDHHGSLQNIPCASKAVEFFDTGKTSSDSCSGA